MNRIKEEKRVVVTGLGLVTSLGNNIDTTWKNILIGNSGVCQIKKWGDLNEIRNRYNLPEKFPLIAGEIKDFDIKRCY